MMLPSFWVVSTKPAAALVVGQARSLGEREGAPSVPRDGGPGAGVYRWEGHGLEAIGGRFDVTSAAAESLPAAHRTGTIAR